MRDKDFTKYIETPLIRMHTKIPDPKRGMTKTHTHVELASIYSYVFPLEYTPTLTHDEIETTQNQEVKSMTETVNVTMTPDALKAMTWCMRNAGNVHTIVNHLTDIQSVVIDGETLTGIEYGIRLGVLKDATPAIIYSEPDNTIYFIPVREHPEHYKKVKLETDQDVHDFVAYCNEVFPHDIEEKWYVSYKALYVSGDVSGTDKECLALIAGHWLFVIEIPEEPRMYAIDLRETTFNEDGWAGIVNRARDVDRDLLAIEVIPEGDVRTSTIYITRDKGKTLTKVYTGEELATVSIILGASYTDAGQHTYLTGRTCKEDGTDALHMIDLSTLEHKTYALPPYQSF